MITIQSVIDVRNAEPSRLLLDSNSYQPQVARMMGVVVQQPMQGRRSPLSNLCKPGREQNLNKMIQL